MTEAKEGILSLKDWEISHLPHSNCVNCEDDLRLYEGKWYHCEMFASKYFLNNTCEKPEPLPCQKCGATIDYKTTTGMYYDFQCLNCIANDHKGDKIGVITMELRQQLEAGTHKHLKYGTSCSVVVTPRGIFFEDIC